MLDRNNSLDKVNIKGWIWDAFLGYAIDSLLFFKPESLPLSKDFLTKETLFGSKTKSAKAVTQTWACKTAKLKLIRAACVKAGDDVSVLNFVIHPFHFYELPFFGADLVTLPSGHLIAIDLQPVIKSDSIHTEIFSTKLSSIFQSWNRYLPPGGKIPENAQEYFSPSFLWTRLPLEIDSEIIIEKYIYPAFCDYLNLYLDLVKDAEMVSLSRSEILLSGQTKYLRYRSENDPARGMLKRFYGNDWTESYIQDVLFSID